ncbi:cytidine deaminase [Acetobacteraceae bacterium KSS8]|uniref:Cytidine deaminase n=1 Tax=Endosaccharibacter trunci TaxID=2812733 RepID=A0ABT1W2R1_9PROT|nr:cytidine deaminase [Acetobacteraceae bacterium KSS8]
MADAMIEAALKARENSYAAYSRFRVGAAIRCERGIVHPGCNVENAAYPQGVCAEAGAISAMILSGSRRIEEVVVAGGGSTPCMPCGGCRQKLREFARPDVAIRVVDEHGTVLLVRTLAELLPDSFGPESLA